MVECLQLDKRILESVIPLGYLKGTPDTSHVFQPLVGLQLEERTRIVSEILVYYLLRFNAYDARVRATIVRLSSSLDLTLETLLEIEREASDFLTNAEDLKQLLESDQAEQLTRILVDSDELDVDKAEKDQKVTKNRLRIATISAAAITGGILIG